MGNPEIVEATLSQVTVIALPLPPVESQEKNLVFISFYSATHPKDSDTHIFGKESSFLTLWVTQFTA